MRIASVKYYELLLLSREIWEDTKNSSRQNLTDFSFFSYFEIWNNHPVIICECECTPLESAQTAQNIETQDSDNEKQNRRTTHNKHFKLMKLTRLNRWCFLLNPSINLKSQTTPPSITPNNQLSMGLKLQTDQSDSGSDPFEKDSLPAILIPSFLTLICHNLQHTHECHDSPNPRFDLT